MSDIFYRIYSELPRCGPGDDASTRRAVRMLDPPSEPQVLDLGCGPGMQTLELARSTGGFVVAVDNHRAYLDQLSHSAREEGLADRIRVEPGDMTALELPDSSFDLIWSEGAIYIVGFERGLRRWRRLLRPRAGLAVTEATWLRSDPPAPLRRFWDEGYPAMNDVAGNLAVAEAEGYEVVGHFVLPQASWWDNYYTPLSQRVERLGRELAGNEAARAILDEARAEIELYREYSDYYGYVFYVLRRSDG